MTEPRAASSAVSLPMVLPGLSPYEAVAASRGQVTSHTELPGPLAYGPTAVIIHSTVSTPTCNGEYSEDPSADRQTVRSSTRHLRQSFDGPSGPGFSSTDIATNSTRLCSPPLFSVLLPPSRRPAVYCGRVDTLALCLNCVFLRALA